MILKVLKQGHIEALAAIGNGKKPHRELEMSHQHLNSVQKVEYECQNTYLLDKSCVLHVLYW